MIFRMRGPEGAMARMQELEARIAQFDTPPAAPEFKTALSGALGGPAAMEGEIPFNPFGGASEVKATQAPDNLKDKIAAAANEAGLDPALFDALVAQESSYDPTARSRAGAMGLTQLMPETAKSLGVTNPFDPVENLRGGARYLAGLMKRFQDPALALAAYNAGPGRVERAGNQIPNIAETQDYVNRVLSRYRGKPL